MSDTKGSDEEVRLATLYELGLLDTPSEPAFDRITRLVAAVINVPVAMVSLIDADRQWLKSQVGNTPRELPRKDTFCTHTIARNAPLVIEDAQADERFANSPLVTAPGGPRFYAGIPLFSSQGFALGALCAIDTKPRQLSHAELAAMQDLAAILTDEIHLRERLIAERKKAYASQRALKALHESMEKQIERRTRELNLVIESAYDAYVSLDGQGVVLDWNRAAETMFGWSRKQALARPITQLIFPEGLPVDYEQAAIMATARRYDGNELPVEVRVKKLMIDGRERRSLFIHDVTERRQLERLRDQQAREDVLTKLPNRRALDERLPEAMARARRFQPLAVLFMDLDGFKSINDTHGHVVGDELLRKIAKRLRKAVRETDFVARWAGDEFVLLLEGSESSAIEPFANKLIHLIEEPMSVGDVALNVSVSVGVAMYLSTSQETANELLKRADTAMYDAKHSGKAQVRIADVASLDTKTLKDEHDSNYPNDPGR